MFADRVADAWIKAQAYRLHTFGTVTRLAGGRRTRRRIVGDQGVLVRPRRRDASDRLDLQGAEGEAGRLVDRGLLFALGGPIYAGTNEIQRNIIAERLLGLPRESK